jgi:glutamate-1-semialdehyde 2,1-aminomutase
MAKGAVATARSVSLLSDAEQYIAGECLGAQRMVEGTSFVAARAAGSHLWDVDGNEYVDCVMGNGPHILGHAPEAVVRAVRRQALLGSHFVALNEPAIELARMLVDAIPCAEVVRFTHSGTEATFFALRMARAFTGRDKILKFEGGFHGHQDYTLQSFTPSRISDYPEGIPDSLGIPSAVGGTVLVAPFNNAEFAVDLIERYHEELAAVIVEPLQRVIEPAPGFLQALRDVTARFGIILIFDEIVTGFRLAWGGGQERYGVVPDIATQGKAMSGGYPIAAVCGRRDILQTSDPRRAATHEWAYFGGTFNGNPISAVAAVAALKELRKPGTYDRIRAVGRRLREGLPKLAAARSISLKTPGDDTFFLPVFTTEDIHDYAGMLRCDVDLGRRFGVELLHRGVFNTPNGKWYMSAAHTDEDVDKVLGIAEQAMAAL